jgi:hypothetical protein
MSFEEPLSAAGKSGRGAHVPTMPRGAWAVLLHFCRGMFKFASEDVAFGCREPEPR